MAETIVHPEVPSEQATFQEAGSTITTPSGYEYTASGTASATQDLIGYGELDINGNPVQTSSVDESNVNAQYAGV